MYQLFYSISIRTEILIISFLFPSNFLSQNKFCLWFLTENSANYTLTIYAITLPEHGVYTCKVKNESESATVNVKAKKEPSKVPPGDFRSELAQNFV